MCHFYLLFYLGHYYLRHYYLRHSCRKPICIGQNRFMLKMLKYTDLKCQLVLYSHKNSPGKVLVALM